MFDLWGEATRLPLPSLELEPAGVSDREKASWEKELLGVSFSRRLFDPSKINPSVTLCGQIDAELVGQTVVVAGRVTSVRYLFTRDSKPFASAILEDVSGQIEVMVWPRVYMDTRDLWLEDSELVVEGKVRVRDDRVQLHCDSVSRYQPEAVQAEEVMAAEPVEVPLPAEETPADTVLTEKHRLVITMAQTSDKENDIACLRKLISTLKEFSGEDEVTLRVKIGEQVDSLKLPGTNYCPELHQQLAELVGEDGLLLEPLA